MEPVGLRRFCAATTPHSRYWALTSFSRFREFPAIGKTNHYESAATPTDRQWPAGQWRKPHPVYQRHPRRAPLSYDRPIPTVPNRMLTALAFALRPDHSGTVATCGRMSYHRPVCGQMSGASFMPKQGQRLGLQLRQLLKTRGSIKEPKSRQLHHFYTSCAIPA
jgi:hypothetical protein